MNKCEALYQLLYTNVLLFKGEGDVLRAERASSRCVLAESKLILSGIRPTHMGRPPLAGISMHGLAGVSSMSRVCMDFVFEWLPASYSLIVFLCA